jgi:hypothetical protein
MAIWCYRLDKIKKNDSRINLLLNLHDRCNVWTLRIIYSLLFRKTNSNDN